MFIPCFIENESHFVSITPWTWETQPPSSITDSSSVPRCYRKISPGRSPRKDHRLKWDMPWEPTARKRDHPNRVDECCPSVTEIIQPLGGVSKSGRILELYRDPNSTQSFYQTSCKEGVKGHPCRYMNRSTRSMCVQRYTYTYALVREFNSNEPWRLDYIRVRSGCSCEVKTFYGWRKKNVA
ncbi:UNVERIFIED_CONTAM: hypothetical protein NCL1_52714 [Trichonephila clavipes]